MALADDFERAMRDIYRQATQIGYQPGMLTATIDQRGGVGAAKQLTLRLTAGFTRLYELKRLDLTVEALMVQPKWAELFTDEEVQRSRRRLSESGYTP